jgi:hypothetical protein
MVRPLKLVFDDGRVTAVVLAYEVDAERASCLLAFEARQVEVEDLVEDIDVFL